MGNPWKLKKTTKKNDGREIFHYEVDGYTCEIDEVEDGFIIGDANFEYLNEVDTKAKSRQALLKRLNKCFVGY